MKKTKRPMSNEMLNLGGLSFFNALGSVYNRRVLRRVLAQTQIQLLGPQERKYASHT